MIFRSINLLGACFRYYAGSILWPQLQAGQTLQLTLQPVSDPRNAFDINAIRIKCNGTKIDCVPRLENGVAAGLLSHGKRLSACIASLTVDDP